MSGKHIDIEHWSRIASEWTAWARAPNHDEFWAYRGSLIAFIGQGDGDALDVGCGEGRVSRVLKECGYRVTAIDPVEKLVSAAEKARSADAYRIAAAADLPFENCSFDLVVAYNVLMDVEDVLAALKEIRRVLRPSGILVISIVHPFADRGHFAGPEANASFVLHDSYFGWVVRGHRGAQWAKNAFRWLVTALGKLCGRAGKCGLGHHIVAGARAGHGS